MVHAKAQSKKGAKEIRLKTSFHSFILCELGGLAPLREPIRRLYVSQFDADASMVHAKAQSKKGAKEIRLKTSFHSFILCELGGLAPLREPIRRLYVSQFDADASMVHAKAQRK